MPGLCSRSDPKAAAGSGVLSALRQGGAGWFSSAHCETEQRNVKRGLVTQEASPRRTTHPASRPVREDLLGESSAEDGTAGRRSCSAADQENQPENHPDHLPCRLSNSTAETTAGTARAACGSKPGSPPSPGHAAPRSASSEGRDQASGARRRPGRPCPCAQPSTAVTAALNLPGSKGTHRSADFILQMV